MKTTKEIRQQMKAELGYNARQVSVKDDGCSFRFTIRDASVDFSKVEEFANNFESIDRCAYSGEILSGGNTFIHVQVTDEVREEWAKPFSEPLEAALKSEDREERVGHRIEGVDGASLFFDFGNVYLYLFREGSSVSNDRSPQYNLSLHNERNVKSVVTGLGVWLHRNL